MSGEEIELRVLNVASLKGGVGKTTAALLAALNLGRRGRELPLLIDLDFFGTNPLDGMPVFEGPEPPQGYAGCFLRAAEAPRPGEPQDLQQLLEGFPSAQWQGGADGTARSMAEVRESLVFTYRDAAGEGLRALPSRTPTGCAPPSSGASDDAHKRIETLLPLFCVEPTTRFLSSRIADLVEHEVELARERGDRRVTVVLDNPPGALALGWPGRPAHPVELIRESDGLRVRLVHLVVCSTDAHDLDANLADLVAAFARAQEPERRSGWRQRLEVVLLVNRARVARRGDSWPANEDGVRRRLRDLARASPVGTRLDILSAMSSAPSAQRAVRLAVLQDAPSFRLFDIAGDPLHFTIPTVDSVGKPDAEGIGAQYRAFLAQLEAAFAAWKA